MGKQLIIAVSREFGSGGHEIADILAKKFNIPIYDNNLLTEIANSKNLDVDMKARAAGRSPSRCRERPESVRPRRRSSSNRPTKPTTAR